MRKLFVLSIIFALLLSSCTPINAKLSDHNNSTMQRATATALQTCESGSSATISPFATVTPTPGDLSTAGTVPAQVAQDQVFRLTNLKLGNETIGADIPAQGALLRDENFALSKNELSVIVSKLKAKGWGKLSADARDGLLSIGPTTGGSLFGDAAKHRKLAAQFLADSGLPALLKKHGMELETEPSSCGADETLYAARLQGVIVPGFIRLNLLTGKNIEECLVHTVHSELLEKVDLIPLAQALPNAFCLKKPSGKVNSDTPLSVMNARMIYVHGIPVYDLMIPIPNTRGICQAFALAVPQEKLQAWPDLAQQYQTFQSGNGGVSTVLPD